MDLIVEGIREALNLLIHWDRQVFDAALRSIWISALAVALASMIGLPIGTILGRRSFFGSRIIVILSRAAMALPTVFVGLVCYSVFSRRGPLGSADLLYSPWAIVAGEFVLALPIVISICQGAIKSLDSRVGETAFTLGAGPLRRWQTYLSEARVGVTLAILTAFSRCVTELGIAMMVGGNIKERTRTLATATALETGKGEFGRGLAMGMILLTLAVGITFLIAALSRENETRES